MTMITVNWWWLMHINQDVKYLISIDWSQLIELWGFCKHMLPFCRCSFGFSFLSFLIRRPLTIVYHCHFCQVTLLPLCQLLTPSLPSSYHDCWYQIRALQHNNRNWTRYTVHCNNYFSLKARGRSCILLSTYYPSLLNTRPSAG